MHRRDEFAGTYSLRGELPDGSWNQPSAGPATMSARTTAARYGASIVRGVRGDNWARE
jgi:hypothetical protein